MSDEAKLREFIDTWSKSGGAERANYQLFLTQLCGVLDLPAPAPTVADDSQNTYVFEKNVTFKHADGTTSTGRIDLYRRGCFVCETKQGTEARRTKSEDDLAASLPVRRGHGVRGTKAWDDAMIAARGQAEQYVRAIPDDNPPFIVVMDVGYSIELYADFSRLGKVYTPFPDAQNHRLKLDQLADPAIRARLRALWLDPLSLDPSRRSAKVTREIADKLARLAKSLERAGHHAEVVAHFLMRCLFTLFAEDVKLIKNNAFTDLLSSFVGQAKNVQYALPAVWKEMDAGTQFSTQLRQSLLRFNGGLFHETNALDLNEEQLAILIDAAKADWKDVEPAIFGTLLERALDPTERHKLGAHYTPRAYVERLVLPTIIEPLREDWDAARTASLAHANAGDTKSAVAEARAFLDKLCDTVVLDPACGTGNFLYVAMHRMKALEGEVRDWLRQLGDTQGEFEIRGQTVDPHQFRGIEINPRAAAIADLVLWIGYLQWHFQTYGNTNPPEPVLKAFHNIENRDAVLAYDARELVTDDTGKPVTRWDGVTMKKSPVTGEDVPDESARTPVYRYVNPRKAEWPKADFVVGNPPFLGKGAPLRSSLGEGYVEALHRARKDVSRSSDFVMYWWKTAADLTANKSVRQFGFITRNSIAQKFNRQAVEEFIAAGGALSFAVPNHPWVDQADGAAVRIAMTVGLSGADVGFRHEVVNEAKGEDGEYIVSFLTSTGRIHADLRIGIDLLSMRRLEANQGIACPGVQLSGQGFVLTAEQMSAMPPTETAELVRPYIIGKSITDRLDPQFIIDTRGHAANELKARFPIIYQHLLVSLRDQRAAKKGVTKDSQDYADRWTQFAKTRSEFSKALAGLSRYMASSRTSEHRVFVFVDSAVVAESKVLVIASQDAFDLGVLSSRIHGTYSEWRGGWHGVGNSPTYNHTDCFDPFAFPNVGEESKNLIRSLAESLDAHRKRQQALHPTLTITDMYNVLEKLRSAEALSEKDKRVHEQGLVSVLKQIHDDLDAAVFAAYGWPSDLSDEQILEKLVALNHERAEEERRGLIRWLRPDFQNKQQATQLDLIDGSTATPAKGKGKAKAPAAKPKKPAKQPWPKTLPDQAKAVRALLTTADSALTTEDVAARFTRAKSDVVQTLLDTLVSLGQARVEAGRYRV